MVSSKGKVKLREQVDVQASWGLHPELGKEFYNAYRNKNNVLYFHHAPLSKEAYEEYPQTREKGIWMPGKPTDSESSFLMRLSGDRKTIEVFSNVFRDPRATRALITTSKYLPELNGVVIQLHKADGSVQTLGTLKDVASKSKTIEGKSPSWTKDKEKEREFQSFKFEVLEEISDVDWFHATSIKNLESIMSSGLKPSKSFTQGSGWTQLNFDLQNAVYLTADKEYAEDIAETLLGRFDAPGVVIRVKGSALKDYSKIVVDEDSLRNEIDGSVSGGFLISDLPDFMTSFLDRIESIGYKGTIAPGNLSVESVVDLEQKPDDFEEDEWNRWDPEVLIYTWNEWKQEMKERQMKTETVSQRLKRVLKESLLLEQEEAPADDFDLPEPPSGDDSGADAPDLDAEAGGDVDADMGDDTSLEDAGGDAGLEGDDASAEDGGDFDFGGGGGGFGGGGGGGFDFGGGDDGGLGDEGGDTADSEDDATAEEEPKDPVEFAVEEAKKLAEENGNIQQILTVVKSIITDRAITPEQLNSIVSQLKAENDVVLSAVSNRLLMFAKGF